MKYLFTAFLLVTFFTCTYAQINWSDFKEPDGKLQRFTIDPRITFNSTSNDAVDSKNFRTQLLNRYSLRQVKERQVVNFNIQHDLVYNSDKQTNMNESVNRISNDINIIGDYTYYLKERRGLFLRAQPSLQYNYSKVSNFDGVSTDQLDSKFLIGYGRLENVSTVYQAIRIDKNLYGNEGLDQEKLFNMASALRSLDYNNALDSRMRTVENQALYLQTLEDYGYDVSSYINIANAIDMFRFERPFLLQHGFEISAGLSAISIGNQGILLAAANATYARAINDKWHWTIRGDTALDLFDDINGNNISLRNNISYIPTARTQISFVQSYSHFSRTGSDQLLLGLNASYFVSPQLNLFVNTSYRKTDNTFFGGGTVNQFSHDMGLKYFFF